MLLMKRPLRTIVTGGAIRRLKLRAGVPRLEKSAKTLGQGIYQALVKEVLRKALVYKQYRQRMILEPNDILAAAKFLQMTLYT